MDESKTLNPQGVALHRVVPVADSITSIMPRARRFGSVLPSNDQIATDAQRTAHVGIALPQQPTRRALTTRQPLLGGNDHHVATQNNAGAVEVSIDHLGAPSTAGCTDSVALVIGAT